MRCTTAAVLILLASTAIASRARAQFPPQHCHSQDHHRALMLWQDDWAAASGCDEASCGWIPPEPACGTGLLQSTCGAPTEPGAVLAEGAGARRRTNGLWARQYVRTAPHAAWFEPTTGPPAPPPAWVARQTSGVAAGRGSTEQTRDRDVQPATAVVVRLEDMTGADGSLVTEEEAKPVSSRRFPQLKPIRR